MSRSRSGSESSSSSSSSASSSSTSSNERGGKRGRDIVKMVLERKEAEEKRKRARELEKGRCIEGKEE